MRKRWIGRMVAQGGRTVRWMWRSGHRQQLTKNLGPIVSAMSGLVLDVGGGRDSPLATSWTPRAKRIRVDISAAFAPEVQADAACLPIAGDSFDAVVMSEVLEHVPTPAVVIDEVFRVLKPGGTFAGSVPFLCQGIHADPHDYFRYTEQSLRLFMAEFDDVTITPHGNSFGVAWRMVLTRLHVLVPLNPIMRQLSRATDPMNAEGYTFTARKPR